MEKVVKQRQNRVKFILVAQVLENNKGALQEYRDSIFSDFLAKFLHDYESWVTNCLI